MRGRTRMQHQSARVANIRKMRCQHERTNELAANHAAARLIGTLHPEGEYRSNAQRQQFFRAFVVRVPRQTGVVHVGDARILNQPVHDLFRVGEVRIHALRQGFDALKQVECRLRRERGAEVAQLLGTQFCEEPVFAEVPPPRDVIVRRHRLGHEREVAVRPVEPSALNNHAAEGGSVPA